MLKKPHPFIFNWVSVLLPSLITFFVLLILKPFEFAKFPIKQLISWGAIFALLVGVVILISVSVVKRIFHRTIEENWTVGKEIMLVLFVLAIISLLVFILFLILNPQTNWVNLFRLVVVRTLAASVFPVLILVLFEQYYQQKIKRQEAEKLNNELLKKQEILSQVITNQTPVSKIMLVAENQKAALQIAPTNLFFVKSDGNYVEVFYRQNQKIQKTLVRNSLKAIEEQLPGTVFFRCHKRFLINLQYIQKVEGNARNFELILDNFEEKIPVSRSKSEMLLQLFQQKV